MIHFFLILLVYLILARADLVTNLITTDGGVIEIADIVLRIDAGSLAEDTEIISRIDYQNVDLKSLFDLGLIQRASNVVEFFPHGLKFLKPANLMFRHEKVASDDEPVILHGSYNRIYRRIVWEWWLVMLKRTQKQDSLM